MRWALLTSIRPKVSGTMGEQGIEGELFQMGMGMGEAEEAKPNGLYLG